MSPLQNDPKNPKEVHMAISPTAGTMAAVKSAPTGSMTAAKSTVVSCSNTACTWIANTARSTGNAVNAGAAKIIAFVTAAFQALAKYASAMAGHTRHFAAATMNAMKANPQIAIGGGLLVVLLGAAAIYAYTQRTANA